MTKSTTPERLPRQILESTGIDRICEMIIEGKLLREIARELGIKGHASLIKWINDDEARAKAVEAARKLAAFDYDEQALEVIRAAKNKIQISRAREEASHLRWRASKMNPKQFSDKIDLNHSGDVVVRVKDYTGRKKDGDA